MTVFAKQYGRLGNNLFQKAAAIGYAIKNGIEYSLLNPIAFASLYSPTTLNIREKQHSYADLHYETGWRNVMLDGYWQSEKYFAHCREEVLKAFGYKWDPRFGWCSIHVRRGDYLKYPDKHPVVTEDYMEIAIDQMVKRTGVRNFMVFSDDIPFCKEWMDADFYDDCHFEFSEGRTEQEDLELMSGCEHNIISNSTFSWWGAWLSQNPDKVVISPSKDNWFGPGNAHLDTSDLIPDSWIQIKY